MKQKFLILMAALCIALISHASDFTYTYQGQTLCYTILGNTCYVEKPLHYIEGEVVIPESVSYEGAVYEVKYISNLGSTNITSITIPSSVKEIWHEAFRGCSNLSSITIPKSVNKIEYEAFSGCAGLESVIIEGDVTKIEDITFEDCTNLITVVIPNSVTSIGGAAFASCKSLKSINLPENLTTIGMNAFSGCKNLTSIAIPESVISIGFGAFMGCLSLESFYGKHVTADNKCLIIDNILYGFASKGLTNYNIPDGITVIGTGAFWGSQLTSVIMPGTIETIAPLAFCGCQSLSYVYIPESVTNILDHAFDSCGSLKKIELGVRDPNNLSLNSTAFYNIDKTSCVLSVPLGSKELYSAADQWKDFTNIEEYSREINLIDGESYSLKEDRGGVDVSYTRTFTPDIWQPLYVPFNMSYDEWKGYGQVAELSCVHAYEDGRTTIEFVTVNSGELLPNVPYVFLPNTGDEITFTCTNKILKAAPTENNKFIMCSSPRYTFKIYGNYQPVSGTTLATYGDSQFYGAYVMTTDNKFQHCSPSATLKPYRFYITREKSTNGYWGAPARQNAPAAEEDEEDVIYFMVDGKVCGVADIVTDSDGNGVTYDLTGREVKNPSNGIYIQNGKKIRIY